MPRGQWMLRAPIKPPNRAPRIGHSQLTRFQLKKRHVYPESIKAWDTYTPNQSKVIHIRVIVQITRKATIILLICVQSKLTSSKKEQYARITKETS
jgi:hypothetical protein